MPALSFLTQIPMKTQDLTLYTGSQQFYEHRLLNKTIMLTEGSQYVKDEGKAAWLFDLILSYQLDLSIAKEEFQCWKLTRKGSKGHIQCTDGNKNLLVEQKIALTDFPLEEIDIWFVNGVAMLPSEY